jgi:hypothetical protein
MVKCVHSQRQNDVIQNLLSKLCVINELVNLITHSLRRHDGNTSGGIICIHAQL